MIRAVLEGVAFSQKECLDVFAQMGVCINDMTLCGGGSRSALWRRILADLYGCPVKTLRADEGGALGAAILAGVCSGVYSSLEQACGAIIKKKEPVMPDEQHLREYEPYFELYKKLYTELLAEFTELARI